MTGAAFAVIGGGPAGASAARRLAAAGASVLLFERRPMPRPKICGGALSARAMAYLDFPLPDALVDAQVFGLRAHVGRMTAEARLDRRVAVLVTRARFDQFLVSKAQEAGARVVWQPVRSLRVRPDAVVLTTPGGEDTAACAIICEGANRRLGRAVCPPDAPHQRLFALAADVPVARTDSCADQDGCLDIYHGLVDWGYGWVFHHGAYYSVGVTGLASLIRRPREALVRFVVERGLSLDGVAVRGGFIPCGGVRRRRTADRLLLAGDAAGLADPFQGEGLTYAIRSGQLAADAVLAAAQRGDFSRRTLAGYDHACRATFDRDLRRARVLARLMYRWPMPLLRGVTSEAQVLRRYLRIMCGESTYGEFLRWFVPRALWRWTRERFARLRRGSV
ncbi:MAG TPA: geranylgeranyl reductase family protein [Phycisphaerae bacterium]|nr:geranylgeranyl reductase family protein [Phycisphaerae bacterium]